MFGNEKHRTKVAADDEERARYIQKKSEYLKAGKEIAVSAGLIGKEATAAAWDFTYKQLWREFQCCYYSCSGLLFNAIGEDYIFEIYELAQEIAAAPVILPPGERKINSKEDYHATWFNHNHL